MLVGLCGNAGVGKDAVADFMVKNHGFVRVALADPLKRICRDVYHFTDEQLWGSSAKRNAPDIRWPHGAQGCRDAALREFEFGKARADSFVGGGWRTDIDVLRYFTEALMYADEGWLSPRRALQRLGTEWGRWCSLDTWVRYALNVHSRLQTDCIYDYTRGLSSVSFVGDAPSDWARRKKDIVISDVRFRNETKLLQAAGGRVVRITRKERPVFQAGAGVQLGDEIPETLADLMKTATVLSAVASSHVSETEQKELPDELFDHHLINDGNSLELLEAAVHGLDATLRA